MKNNLDKIKHFEPLNESQHPKYITSGSDSDDPKPYFLLTTTTYNA